MAGIYIHIPFCRQKCHYCNFFSVASLKYKDDFLNALKKEIELQQSYLENETVDTIYFGGGTPSLLSINELEAILEKIYNHFPVNQHAEITLEANPDNLSNIYIKELKQTPVNRLSIGIQSFFDADLQYINRIHTGQQAVETLKKVIAAKFENISIDLIYGIPTLTDKHWTENLQTLMDFQIPHISAYCLTIEQGTALEKLVKNKKKQAVDENTSVRHFEMLMDILEANNYLHYEISNFCMQGFLSKHNSNYWLNKKYLGLGPSAHSYDLVSRQWNVNKLLPYLSSIQQNIIPCEKEQMNPIRSYNEYILTRLRTMWGCSLKEISSGFGEKFSNYCMQKSAPFIKDSLLKIDKDTLYLTRKGKLLADRISASLFMEEPPEGNPPELF